MKLVKAWRVVTEVREPGERMGKGLAKQDTGGGACWDEIEFNFKHVESRLPTQYHFEG